MMRDKLKARYRFVAVFLLAMAIAHGIEFWQQRARVLAGYGDFSALYTAGLLVRRGEGRLLYDGHEQWRVQQEFSLNVDIRKGPMPFIRPPFEALVFLPLAYFSYPVAFAIWSLAKLVLLWLTARVLPRPHPFSRIYPSWLEVVLCLGFFPGTAALLALSCVISGTSVLSAYPTYLLNLNRTPGVGFVTAQSMPNLRGLLTAFVGRAPYPGPIHWLLLPASVAAIVIMARYWRPLMNTGFPGLGLGYCLALLVAILTSYYARSYDMTLLIIPLLLLGSGFLDQPGLPPLPRRMIAGGLLLVICTPLYWTLILQLDRPYLLVVPMFILALGIAKVMRQSLPATA